MKEVSDILKQPLHIQKQFFQKKRKEGIFLYNMNLIKNNKEPEMRERTSIPKDKLRVCTGCKGFYSHVHFYKHTRKCKSDVQLPQAMKPVLLKKADSRMECDSEFRDILNCFPVGEVGDFCHSNAIVKMFGYHQFCLRKQEVDQHDEVKKTVMSEMRELTELYFQFKQLTSPEETSVEDMFDRKNVTALVLAVEQLLMTEDNYNTLKYSTRLFVNAVILGASKALEIHYTETQQDVKMKELKCFIAEYMSSSQLYLNAKQTCAQNLIEQSPELSDSCGEERQTLGGVQCVLEGSGNVQVLDKESGDLEGREEESAIDRERVFADQQDDLEGSTAEYGREALYRTDDDGSDPGHDGQTSDGERGQEQEVSPTKSAKAGVSSGKR